MDENKLLIIGGIFIFLITILPLASASISDFGVYKQGENITLYQICSNCTYNNITVISPNATVLVSNKQMTLDTDPYRFYYNLSENKTWELGQYKVHGIGDDGGTATFWTYTFEVTKSGYASEDTNFMLLIIALCAVIVILIVLAALLNESHMLLAVIFVVIAFFLLTPVVQTANLAIENNYLDSGLSDIISTIERILVWIDYALIVYIIVYIFVKVISNYNQKKQLRMEGLG